MFILQIISSSYLYLTAFNTLDTETDEQMFFLFIEKDFFPAFCPELKKFRVISDDKNQKLGWSVNSFLLRWKVEPTPWEKRKMIILSFCSVLNRVFHIHDLQTDLLGQLYLKLNIYKVFGNFWHSFGSFMIFLCQSLFLGEFLCFAILIFLVILFSPIFKWFS